MEGLNFIALDFETATARRSSICEAGICIVKDGKIVETKSWLVQPEGNVYNWWNIQVHGIQPEETAEAPSFAEIWNGEMKSYFEQTPVIVAHNAAFDTSCLKHALEDAEIELPKVRVFCSCRAARHLYDFPSNSLENLCFEFDIDSENHHRAGADAQMCAKLFLREVKDSGWLSLDEMSWCENEI
ncbi:MAG: 3'-5' exonuclease [Bacteroidales bacterium]|nr:3'-5' exonuclease [Bacteroidales bacterium]